MVELVRGSISPMFQVVEGFHLFRCSIVLRVQLVQGLNWFIDIKGSNCRQLGRQVASQTGTGRRRHSMQRTDYARPTPYCKVIKPSARQIAQFSCCHVLDLLAL